MHVSTTACHMHIRVAQASCRSLRAPIELRLQLALVHRGCMQPCIMQPCGYATATRLLRDCYETATRLLCDCCARACRYCSHTTRNLLYAKSHLHGCVARVRRRHMDGMAHLAPMHQRSHMPPTASRACNAHAHATGAPCTYTCTCTCTCTCTFHVPQVRCRMVCASLFCARSGVKAQDCECHNVSCAEFARGGKFAVPQASGVAWTRTLPPADAPRAAAACTDVLGSQLFHACPHRHLRSSRLLPRVRSCAHTPRFSLYLTRTDACTCHAHVHMRGAHTSTLTELLPAHAHAMHIRCPPAPTHRRDSFMRAAHVHYMCIGLTQAHRGGDPDVAVCEGRLCRWPGQRGLHSPLVGKSRRLAASADTTADRDDALSESPACSVEAILQRSRNPTLSLAGSSAAASSSAAGMVRGSSSAGLPTCQAAYKWNAFGSHGDGYWPY